MIFNLHLELGIFSIIIKISFKGKSKASWKWKIKLMSKIGETFLEKIYQEFVTAKSQNINKKCQKVMRS